MLQATEASCDTELITVLVPGEERPYQWYNCRVYYGRRSRCQGRTPGCCDRVRRLRSFQCCHRFIYAYGMRKAKGQEKMRNGHSLEDLHSAASSFYRLFSPLFEWSFHSCGGAPRAIGFNQNRYFHKSNCD